MSQKHYANLINGEWVDSAQAITNVNPSDTNDTVGTYAHASISQVDDAVAAAREAFLSWSQSALEERKRVLDFIGNELIARSAELGELLAREEGKPKAEGIGEVYRAGQFFQYFGAEVLRQMGETAASVRPGIDVEVHREALGVVGLITPWNFPTAIAAWKAAPALAYGNTVVLKPSELTPASAWALAEIIHRSGLPDGAFNLVMGSGKETGEQLTRHRDVDAVSFTGSEEALSISNDSDYGLTAGIMTQSLKHAAHFKRHAQAGCVMVNLPTAGTDYHVPFGGRKASSYGPREQGTYAKEFYSVVKTSYSQPY